ncbi:hydrogenase nickel incorporation protein HypA/HybF [Thermosulfidibacter takaii ABI70S6]|uniref:Hydrogenase maturation factor HypA n=1 Tax=Thermosulfidibacter takaii (strain DSM 17441 / JCM 13301 / NBRC 103674 / ABI70S6) TaxID=1298851 RepID=A0A0S3QUE4_THET7|nr:hydrogenase maturation nickel metallochaperone HypA [Thermosulfidibacter takaii]BAT71944.1 hydrogenase nickel incorporation protein HypA/HybF [Thermosulfidibacter takaii ABI70S6]
MHESTLAQSLIKMLLDIAEREKAKKVISCTVKVGKLSGVVVESFKFAFNVLKKESEVTKGAELVIEEVELTYRCGDCGEIFKREDFFFVECPKCGSMKVELVSGEEFDLDAVELEV